MVRLSLILTIENVLFPYRLTFFVSLQGPPKVAATEPKDFLAKHSKEFKLPESKQRSWSFS